MFKSLTIKNFTVFAEVKIEFSPGLNVIIGDNATGKTHLLKLGYSVIHTLSRKIINGKKTLADKLYDVFKINSLGHLTRHGSDRQRTQIAVEMGLTDNRTETLQFSFAKNSRSEVTLDQTISGTLPNHAALFIPTREVFSLHPEVTALYEKRYMGIDETHYDLFLVPTLCVGMHARTLRVL
jgi:recombinational DNA repair ATPase RecF